MIHSDLKKISNVLRRDVLKMTTVAGSGHPTSCLSCADIMSVLFFDHMRYDIKNAFNEDNDEFILSKGHAAPILYSALYRAGAIKDNLMSLRKLNSNLEGHPIPSSLKWAKVASGSLGQGLSVGVGMALAAKLQNKNYKTYVLVGDSEMAEGSVYEALQLASYYKLNNLVLIVDFNRLGQRGETMTAHNSSELGRRIASFEWDVSAINGHDFSQVRAALGAAMKTDKPSAIIAKTFKGRGVSFLENKENWHGKTLSEEELELALEEIEESKMPPIRIANNSIRKWKPNKNKLMLRRYEIEAEVSTREAYGNALADLALSNEKVLALDGEVSNSTYSDRVKVKTPNQFIECFIAEQNMIGMALGLSKKGFDTYSSTFSAFLSRVYDQIRMAALSSVDMTICGSHAGVSIGEDGASQMGLEDISMFRTLPNSTVLYPSDAVSTDSLMRQCSRLKGIKYIRTTRMKTPVIYSPREDFKIGEFKVLKSSKKDKVVLVGGGITLHECLKAASERDDLAVVDLYCIKPFNHKKFFEFAKKHGNKIIVVEDHRGEGGIGEMLASNNLSSAEIKLLNIKGIPHSGKPVELLQKYEIDASAILKEIKKF